MLTDFHCWQRGETLGKGAKGKVLFIHHKFGGLFLMDEF
jgi:hypothetical protein